MLPCACRAAGLWWASPSLAFKATCKALLCSSPRAGWRGGQQSWLQGAGFSVAGSQPSHEHTPPVLAVPGRRIMMSSPACLARGDVHGLQRSCLRGSSQQPAERENALSSKIAAAQDGGSTSCKKWISQKTAEIFWHWKKEIPAVGFKGMLPENSSLAFQETVSLGLDYFHEFVLHPLSHSFALGTASKHLGVLHRSFDKYSFPGWSCLGCQTQAPSSRYPRAMWSWAGWPAVKQAGNVISSGFPPRCRKLWDGRLCQ